MIRLHDNLVFALRESIDRLATKQREAERRETLRLLRSLVDTVEQEFRSTASCFGPSFVTE